MEPRFCGFWNRCEIAFHKLKEISEMNTWEISHKVENANHELFDNITQGIRRLLWWIGGV